MVPANWPAARRAHWKCLLQARAIENQVYVAGINCFGAQEEAAYTGDSAVFDPLGSRIAGFAGQEQMMLVDIPENITKYRSSFPMKKDRRWELYQKWYRRYGLINRITYILLTTQCIFLCVLSCILKK